MAIDSAVKRRRALRSVTGKAIKGFPVYYIPNGSFIEADRYQRSGLYFSDYPPITGDKIIFTSASYDTDNVTLELDTPLWGYTTTLKLPLEYAQRANGTVGIFDAGAVYDNRVCECTFQVNKTDAESIVEFFRDSLKGRGNNIDLALPAPTGFSGCGWFPFGPDKGDYGHYTVHVMNMVPSQQLIEPLLYWNITLTIVFIDGPTPDYTFPTPVDYGNLQIGTVNYLRYPQNNFKVNSLYGLTEQLLYGKNVGVVDMGQPADTWRTTFDLEGTRSKITEFINYLVTVPRDTTNKTYSPITVVTQNNTFIFGMEGNGTADDGGNTYTVQLLSKDIKIRHVNFDLYKVSLELLMVAKT